MPSSLRYDNLRYYTPAPRSTKPSVIETDVCVYGGTPAGIAAAIQARRMGKKALILEFSQHLGGMTAAGLSRVDVGESDVISGISREFYGRVGQHYGEELKFEYEPAVAERLLGQMVREAKVAVSFQQHLQGVVKNDGEIREVHLENGNVVRAKIFIDATYEGDLMARADVSYAIGREAENIYRETLNGVRFGSVETDFGAWLDPYVRKGDASSGLLPGVSDERPGKQGQGDKAIQAFGFRVCLSDDSGNRMEFPKPALYNRHRFHLLARYLKCGVWDVFDRLYELPGGKADLDQCGAISLVHIGANAAWPDADFRKREKIFQDHVNYAMGLLYFLANDKAVPRKVREQVSQWGLPLDEFVDTGGWPHSLYVKESRRMVGDRVMTEHHCRGLKKVADPIALGSAPIHLHPCRRIIVNGRVVNEGGLRLSLPEPYRISYGAICPRKSECKNLFVPVCLSASHIADASLRNDATQMMLGQAAATAAVIAIDDGVPVQEVDYAVLREELRHDDIALRWPVDFKHPDPAAASATRTSVGDTDGGASADADTHWDSAPRDLPEGWVFE